MWGSAKRAHLHPRFAKSPGKHQPTTVVGSHSRPRSGPPTFGFPPADVSSSQLGLRNPAPVATSRELVASVLYDSVTPSRPSLLVAGGLHDGITPSDAIGLHPRYGLLRLLTRLLRLWSKLLRLRTKLPILPLKPLRGRKLKPLRPLARLFYSTNHARRGSRKRPDPPRLGKAGRGLPRRTRGVRGVMTN